MNGIYQAINKLCCYRADAIWNVSPAMIGGRESIGILRSKSAPQITVPLGCDYDTIRASAVETADPHAIVYFGALREEHGPGLILEALPAIRREFPDATAVFAGGGELQEKLERRAAELGVSGNVRFTGFIASDREVYRILTGCGLALATYLPDDNTYKRFCDPGKVKIYLACGLPVMITDVPAVAREIEEKGAGRIVEHSPSALAETVTALFRDPGRHARMRERALALAAEYTWDSIWERTFREMDRLFPKI
jgi:glycosyltransferase involved in cell wall biosynthesis